VDAPYRSSRRRLGESGVLSEVVWLSRADLFIGRGRDPSRSEVLCRVSPVELPQLMSRVAGEPFEVAAHHDSVDLEIRGVLPPCPCLAPAMADDLRDEAFALGAFSVLTANVGSFPRLARCTEFLLVRVQVKDAPCLARASAAVQFGLGVGSSTFFP